MKFTVYTLTKNLPPGKLNLDLLLNLMCVEKLTNEGWPMNLNNVPDPFWKIRVYVMTDGFIL